MICYHHNDLDGKAAAYAVYRFKPKSIIDTPSSYFQRTYDDALDCNINIERNEPQPNNREAFVAAYSRNGIYAIDKYSKQLEPKFLQKVIAKIKNKLNNLAK